MTDFALDTEYAFDSTWACQDCGHHTLLMDEYYMVHDDLWWSFVDDEVMLCVGCLEGRIGRRLESDDFIECPLNDGFFPQSLRLRHRLQLV